MDPRKIVGKELRELVLPPVGECVYAGYEFAQVEGIAEIQLKVEE